MIITGPKVIYNKVAERLNIKYSLVEKVGNHVFEDVNKRIATFEDRELYIYKLGMFRFRKIKSERFISRLDGLEDRLRASGVSEENIEKALNSAFEKKDKMLVLLEQWDKILEEKMEFKIKRNESLSGDIQKQETDLGGVEKQDVQG